MGRRTLRTVPEHREGGGNTPAHKLPPPPMYFENVRNRPASPATPKPTPRLWSGASTPFESRLGGPRRTPETSWLHSGLQRGAPDNFRIIVPPKFACSGGSCLKEAIHVGLGQHHQARATA